MKNIFKTLYLGVRAILCAPALLLRKTVGLDTGTIKTILVLRHDRIGDMVLSTPLFAALKGHFPHARLIVVASQSNQDILRNNPHVDEVIIYKNIWSFMRLTRARSIDLAIDPFVTYAFWPALLAWACGARYRTGYAIASRELFFNTAAIRPAVAGHMAGYIAALAKPLGIAEIKTPPEVFLDEKEKAWARNYLGSLGCAHTVRVALHPGGFYPSQRWPAENFATIAKILIDHYHACVYILGDRKEVALGQAIQKAVGRKELQVCCALSLRESMALLHECALLVSNNSGLLHIGCALGIPTVSTMGPTYPLWKPQGQMHIVLRKNLSCSPCDKPCCADHACLKKISVEEMAQAIDAQLSNIITR